MSEPPLYQLERIKCIISRDKVILDIDSLSLFGEELTAIVGPNGAGKSTLINILAFLEKPDQGYINFQGKPVGPRDHYRLRRQVTMVDQTPLLFRGSVFDNVAYGLRIRGIPPEQRVKRVEEALTQVDLGSFAHRSVSGLSGGEIQRVAIARALVFHPQVILLDEPTAGVDVARMEMVESLISELYSVMGISIVFSTHNLAQAHRLTDRIIHLASGRMVPGSIENLFNGHASSDGDIGRVHLHCGAMLRVGPVQAGPIRISIPASAVDVMPLVTSTDQANRIDGTITRMELRGAKVRLLVSGKLNLRAEIPQEDLQRKGLQLGSRVTVTLPPESIQIVPDIS
jgi:tungstate transport system ATP-binding protein